MEGAVALLEVVHEAGRFPITLLRLGLTLPCLPHDVVNIPVLVRQAAIRSQVPAMPSTLSRCAADERGDASGEGGGAHLKAAAACSNSGPPPRLAMTARGSQPGSVCSAPCSRTRSGTGS